MKLSAIQQAHLINAAKGGVERVDAEIRKFTHQADQT
jgi:hypothetical protein